VVGRYYALDRTADGPHKKSMDAIVFVAGILRIITRCRCGADNTRLASRRIHASARFCLPNEQRIRDGDTVLFFKLRATVRASSHSVFDERLRRIRSRSVAAVHFVSLTQYDVRYSSPFIFSPEELKHILGGDLLALPANGNCASPKRRIRACDYFFNAGIETSFPGEDRKLIPSQVATYDLKPEMSAGEVHRRTTGALSRYDF